MNLDVGMNTAGSADLVDGQVVLEELDLSGASGAVVAKSDTSPTVEAPVSQLLEVADRTSTVPAVQSSFDYHRLGAAAASVLQAVERIRSRHCSIALQMIETGKDLLVVKDKLPHGEFGRWLQVEFDWTERTAQNYMNAARDFGDRPELAANLQPTTLYKLTAKSTPEEVKTKIKNDLAAGHAPTSEEIKSQIDAANGSRREAAIKSREETQKNAGKKPEQVEARKKREERGAPQEELERRERDERERLAAKLAEVVMKLLPGKKFSIFWSNLEKAGPLEFFAAVRTLDAETAKETARKTVELIQPSAPREAEAVL